MDFVTQAIRKLEQCVREDRWESVETDCLEVKPVPPNWSDSAAVRQTVCAFLNTRGGVVLLGVRDEQTPHRRFSFAGYTEQQSSNVIRLRDAFKTKRGESLDVSEFLRFSVRAFLDGHVGCIEVLQLSEDRKYCFHDGVAYERVLDQDKRIPERKIEAQEERRREMETSRELRPVEGLRLEDLSLDRINELIVLINQGQSRPIETLKSSLQDAVDFLERRRFRLLDGSISTLGALVCSARPEEHLNFRSHVDAFVDVPNLVAQDKKTYRDNILQLMEAAHGWTLRNIMTGVSAAGGGTIVAEHPETLIRESINNALAHRDYSLDRPVQVTIRPRREISIRNPGRLPAELLVEEPDDEVPVRRIFANPHARNPRLASVLKLHNKWEGKGIGMAELVNFALENKTDVPYYVFHPLDELSLVISAGEVLDPAIRAWFELFDGFVRERTGAPELRSEQAVVLAYLLKCERMDRLGRYTLALTPSNNHFSAIDGLLRAGLIVRHAQSAEPRPIYVVCRELATEECFAEVERVLGGDFESLDPIARETMNMIALAERYSSAGGLNAKQVSALLKHRLPDDFARRGDDDFYRAIRYRVEKHAPEKKSVDLTTSNWHSVPEKMLAIRGPANRPTFKLNPQYQSGLFAR
jgi:predicted HTH transcriptional regulator